MILINVILTLLNVVAGSEFDEDDVQSDNENSDDSWTTQEEFTSELILR